MERYDNQLGSWGEAPQAYPEKRLVTNKGIDSASKLYTVTSLVRSMQWIEDKSLGGQTFHQVDPVVARG